ncbi:putative polyketide synthase [Obba rivulosa]|uniref:Putative polyketide synthase n=1 Tax=Obba rivulosa TaxID=1052685 RepID=A0A8E2DFV5_9APHY|nr:putative polyketide synthase [Obba rivulosa]
MAPGIAIVGISAELPSGSYSQQNLDHESFYEFLMNYGEAYEQIPRDRFNVEAWKGNGIGQIHVDGGAFLKGIDLFDNVEFGISSRDARTMAPVTKKLLENCFLALLDSGIDYRMRNVGCYTAGNSFELSNVTDPDEYEPRGSFAGYPAMVANRVSNHLDLLGPSVPTDTACSSTLTALHLAVQATLNGECEAAVVGGCQLNHRFMDWITYSQGSLLAKDGKCKPFDSSADGFARAEGCVAVVLKPLEDAVRDHDHIYATILGTAINNGGAGAPPGAPVAEAQREAMLQAFKRAGRSPQEVDYVELHATGTAKGDPTEANWVGEEFQREDEVLIGSVKGNIGHTEISAFLASLSKVLSILQNEVVPPNVNIRDLNPAIKWEQYKLKVPMSPTPLPRHTPGKHLVSMAGSGIGGSNGHVILESPPAMTSVHTQLLPQTERPVLLLAGGLSPRSAGAVADSVIESFRSGDVDVPAISTTLGRRARQMTWRCYAVASGDTSSVQFSIPQHCPRVANPLVFVFSGQGPQHIDMGRELFETFPAFRDSVREMDDVFKKVTGKSIINDWGLFNGNASTTLPDTWPISLILPSIAVFQIALFDLLVHLGIKPDIVLGHSAGETAVLYASGAAPKAMAVELAILRGAAFSMMETQGGTMAALSCSADEATQLLDEVRAQRPDDVVEIACYNAPSAVAIAGHEGAIDQVVGLAQARGVFARKIRTRVPIHSSMMEACREEYCAALHDLFARYPGPLTPKVPTYSTFTGERFSGPYDADYFWQNTRHEVRFTCAMEAIGFSRTLTFVEITPHPVLSSYVSSMAHESSTVLATVRRPKPGKGSSEYRDMLEFCGKLAISGHNCLDFTVLNGRACHDAKASIPSYPFLKKQFPLYPDTAGFTKQMRSHLGPLNHQYLRMNKETHPSLGEHIIRGEPIMPAAGFMEMAIEFGASTLMNVNLRSILSLSAERPVKVDVQLDGYFWTVKSIFSDHQNSSSAASNHAERLHADGFLSFDPPPIYPDLDVAEIRKRLPKHVGSGFYPSLSYFSSYGPRMQRVTNIYYGQNEGLASIRGMDETLSEDGAYLLHPAILDACIQVTAYKPFHGNFDPNVYYLPAHVDAVIVHQPLRAAYFPRHVYAHVELKTWYPGGMRYDIALVNDLGKRLCTLQGLEVARHHINPVANVLRPLELVLQPATIPAHPCKHVSLDGHGQNRVFEILNGLSPFAQVGGKAVLNSLDLRGENKPSRPWSSYMQASSPKHGNGTDDHTRKDEPASLGALRDALTFMSSHAGKRAVRVLLLRTDPSLFTDIAQLLTEFPATFFEVFVDPGSATTVLQADRFSGIVRIVTVDMQRPVGLTSQLPPFDVVMSSHDAGQGCAPKTLMETYNSILLPGGTLIITENDDTSQDQDFSGMLWYKNVLGRSTSLSMPLSRLNSWLETLSECGHSLVQVHHTGPSNFTIEAQKHIIDPSDSELLFNPSEGFVFDYTLGHETDLQWEFSGLNIMQELDIWILAAEGQDGGAALGMVRALRREYLSWTIHLVVFPSSYSEEMRQECLERLPSCMEDELDIVISPSGVPMVPRMVPLSQLPPENKGAIAHDISTGQILARTLHSSTYRNVSAVIASVVDANGTGLQEGSTVVTLTADIAGAMVTIDAAIACTMPSTLLQHASAVVDAIPAYVAAILAPGMAAFGSPSRLQSLRILLTHSDTSFGRNIAHVYSDKHLQLTQVTEDVRVLDLLRLGDQSFDLVVSGYGDRAHERVLSSLLRPGRGKLFMWNDPLTGLAGLAGHDPYTVADALQQALRLLEVRAHNPHENLIPDPSKTLRTGVIANTETRAVRNQAAFRADGAYLILGGIGSIGANLALYMYQRGARHIVVTSRSGEKSLHRSTNVMLRRMFEYLKGLKDLRISFVAVDATSRSAMRTLLGAIEPRVTGCIILTAVLSDRVFQHLEEEEFNAVFASKIGVLQAVKDTMDMSNLDFTVAFSSVSGLFGTGGQSNYGAANSALEEAMSAIPNGFSFVCPGILDSSLMLASGTDANEIRLAHFIEWSLTAEDMMLWFDDAMVRYQKGQKFSRYIPNLDWEAMDRTHGMNRLGEHLVPARAITQSTAENDADRMADIVRNVLSISLDDFSAEVPFTAYGLDSLSASRLSFLLRPILDVTQIQLLADLTLNDLQLKLSAASASTKLEGQERTTGKSKAQKMQEMLEKYTHDLQERPPREEHQAGQTEVVLLTGSTGTFGANILAQLLSNDEITKVYALNRRSAKGTSLLKRQMTALVTQGLPSALAGSPKLVLIEGDLLADGLGISTAVLDEILSSVTHIIHNAWTVDFLSSLDDMEDLIKGTRRLLDLFAQSKLPTLPSLSYVSSIGIYQHYKESVPAPEASVLDPKMAVQTGYMESKWVAERLVQIAGAKLALKTNVIRVGLLTGGVNGSWDTSHWLPALVQSAVYVGCLPEGENMVSWIPVDVAAAAVVDLRHASDDTLHVVHPHPVGWATIMEPLASMLEVPLVPYVEWLSRLENIAASTTIGAQDRRSDHQSRNALKLVEFYRLGMRNSDQRISTESMGLLPEVAFQKAVQASPTLQNPRLPSLQFHDIQRWVEYWRGVVVVEVLVKLSFHGIHLVGSP